MDLEKLTFTAEELIVLFKLIYNAKFLCHTFNSFRLAENPISKDLLIKILDAGQNLLNKEGIPVSKNGWHCIDDGKHEEEFDILKRHIQEIDDWLEYTINEKKEIILNLILPLDYREETIGYLVNHGDLYWSNV